MGNETSQEAHMTDEGTLAEIAPLIVALHGGPGPHGGNVEFIPGAGMPACGDIPSGRDGDIVFRLADRTEFLRLCHDGRALVRREVVVENQDVWRKFAKWIAACETWLVPTAAPGQIDPIPPEAPTYRTPPKGKP